MHDSAHRIYSYCLDIASLALRLGEVQRATRHGDGVTRESDTTHTVMLALVSATAAETINTSRNARPAIFVSGTADAPRINTHRVVLLALVHDLVEVYAGDTVAIALTPEQHSDKFKREQFAMRALDSRLTGGLQWIMGAIYAYEAQQCVESRLVRYLDKTLPKFTHILNGGAAVHDGSLGKTWAELDAWYDVQAAELAEKSPDLPELAAVFTLAHREMMRGAP